MDVVKAILSSKSVMQAYKAMDLDFTKARYPFESMLAGFLAAYALNKDKNKEKPDFEQLDINQILTHLSEEYQELKFELEQDTLDYDRLLSETADVAAMLSGLVAWIIEHKKEEG